VLLGIPGAAGCVYVGFIAYKARRLSTYTPDMEDWTWYTALPFIAYAGILASAIFLFIAQRGALFGFAGASLMLIFIGIHNAWDVVTFIATGGNDDDDEPAP
jgi:hypothetical protein